jgi:hypothetical protein
MPKFNDKPDDVVIKKEQTVNSGIYCNAGELQHSDFDTTDWKVLQKDYYTMKISDPIISKCWKMVMNKIATAGFRIEGKNKKINDYSEWCLNTLDGGFVDFVRHLLLAIPFGVTMGEQIVKNAVKYDSKPTNKIIKIAFFQNETIYKFNYDEQSIFQGIEHEKRIPDKGIEYIPIPKEKLHYFVFDQEYGDVTGNGIFRPLRFAWKLKEKVLLSTGISVQRGAGIPIIEVIGNLSDADKAKISQIGRTIGNFKDGYVSYDKNKMNLRIEELKNQQNNIQLLEFLNREIFFGMLSEFSTSGIGQNGSRSATSEHKNTFELALNYIMTLLESNIQSLLNKMIEMSLFGNIKEDDAPVFKFNSLTQIDLNEMSIVYRNLYDSMIVQKQPEIDEAFFRETFGLPEIKKSKKKTNNILPEAENIQMNKSDNKYHRELSKHEKEIFSLSSATEHYETISEKVDIVVNDILEKALEDYASYYENHGSASLRQKYQIEMIEKLNELYEYGYNRGKNDVEKELNKLSTNNLTLSNKFALSSKQSKTSKSIERYTKKLFFNVSTTLDDYLDYYKDNKSYDPYSIKKRIVGFKTEFRRDKQTLKSKTEDGYTDGRGASLKENEKNIETYLYTAILDKKLCDNCAPLDSIELTLQEIRDNELRRGNGRVNPNCLGNNGQWCRCQLVPYKVTEEK